MTNRVLIREPAVPDTAQPDGAYSTALSSPNIWAEKAKRTLKVAVLFTQPSSNDTGPMVNMYYKSHSDGLRPIVQCAVRQNNGQAWNAWCMQQCLHMFKRFALLGRMQSLAAAGFVEQQSR